MNSRLPGRPDRLDGENGFRWHSAWQSSPGMMFNGHHNAVTKTHRMEANMGETVRIGSGVGEPDFTSGFHVVGAISDRVHDLDEVAPPHR